MVSEQLAHSLYLGAMWNVSPALGLGGKLQIQDHKDVKTAI